MKTLLEKGKINSDHFSMADFFQLLHRNLFAKTKPWFEFVEDLKDKGGYTYRRILLTPCQNRVVIYDEFLGAKKEMIMMASNNYLGLSTHPKVLEAGAKALLKYGSGMSGSPLLNGTYDILQRLEEKLAELEGCEEAMVFSTGYSANVGAISGIIRPGDIILIDKLNHASIIDGCKLAGGKFKTFRHNDVESLEKLLNKVDKTYHGKLIVFDGIFSMEGDLCKLPEILKLAKRYEAKVMVDDAHATGVIGNSGGGTPDYFGLKGQVDIVMGTFSKTFASTGGFIASSREIINYLRYYSRSYFFSASPPPSVVATVLASLEVMEEEPQLRERLWANVKYLHDNLKLLGFNVSPSPPQSAIVLILIGDEVRLRKMSKKIHNAGVFLNAVPYPAVPKDQCRFRLSLMATHTREDLDMTLDALKEVGREFGVI